MDINFFKALNKISPENFRPEVADVILLLTHGAHTASEYQTKLVSEYTRILKDKNITIVTLIVGNENEVKKLKPYVERWSSPELIIESKLDELGKVVDEIVNASCASQGNSTEGKMLFRYSNLLHSHAKYYNYDINAVHENFWEIFRYSNQNLIVYFAIRNKIS